MPKAVSNFIFIFLLTLLMANCANRGNPTGGPKDISPPKITKSIPENYSTNFSGTEIKIAFNEYIKIQNLQRQLIISPPMKITPEVTPLGSASKDITIKIFDTLLPNTTYAFNFGNSIVDNNELNPFSYYKYVFSTGDYIDSLQLKGTIVDALKQTPEEFVSVRLYDIDSTFNDSIVYNTLPKYVTNTLDSASTFSLENIKAGKYMLVALKDGNEDNKFQQKTDKIGFYKHFIEVPSDTLYTLKLFKEENDFMVIRPRLVSGEKIAFGYQGDYETTQIIINSKVPNDFKYAITKDPRTDSLNYWYTPRLKDVDSLLFEVRNKNYLGNFTVKISEQERDSLTIKATPSNTIIFNEDFKLTPSTPIYKVDEQKISILDKDSLQVEFKTSIDSLHNHWLFHFDKTEDNTYYFKALPDALTDLFNNTNDTLNYKLKTKTFSDYGNLRVTLQNVTYPVIVQLINDNGDVVSELYSTKPEPLEFRHLTPNTYHLRVVFDTNGNGKFDSGNYLKKMQPERVVYYPDTDDLLQIRPNWDPIIDFILLKQ